MQTLPVHPVSVAVPSRSQRVREEGRVFELYRRTGDQAARAELVTRFLPLARHLANRYRERGEYDDLVQVASYALVKAIDRYDLERGPAFSSFAVPTILGELKRYFRDHGWAVRVPREVQELKLRLDRLGEAMTGEIGRSPTPAELADRADVSIEQVIEALGAATAHYPDSLDRTLTDDGEEAINLLVAGNDPGYTHVENAEMFDGLLAALPDRERLILKLRFEDELTQAEIGRRLDIS